MNVKDSIQVGDLIQYCLDPRYPSAKSSSSLKELQESFNIHVGVVTSKPDKHGYLKIHPTPLLNKRSMKGRNELEIHIEFCKVLA